MARPMATRWRWPPDSVPGFCCRRWSSWRTAAASPTRFLIASSDRPFDAQREGDVFEHRHVRIERVGLEHHGDAALDRGQVFDLFAADDDLAAGHVLKAGDHAQQRGLAAAGRADKDDKLALGHIKVDALDDLGVAEGLAQSCDRTSWPMNDDPRFKAGLKKPPPQ